MTEMVSGAPMLAWVESGYLQSQVALADGARELKYTLTNQQ